MLLFVLGKFYTEMRIKVKIQNRFNMIKINIKNLKNIKNGL